jgi:uncharacterized protein YcbK (DUF882 family)
MLSEFFHRSEFACKCGCGFNTVDAELLEALEAVRKYFGNPVIITSGCRCPDYNRSIDGASPKSQHMRGRAADIIVKDVPAGEVYSFLTRKYYNVYGIGKYADFTHIDTRTGSAVRWQG